MKLIVKSGKTVKDLMNQLGELAVMKNLPLKHQLLMANGYTIVKINRFDTIQEEDLLADFNRN